MVPLPAPRGAEEEEEEEGGGGGHVGSGGGGEVEAMAVGGGDGGEDGRQRGEEGREGVLLQAERAPTEVGRSTYLVYSVVARYLVRSMKKSVNRASIFFCTAGLSSVLQPRLV